MNRYEHRHELRQLEDEAPAWFACLFFGAIFAALIFACVRITP